MQVTLHTPTTIYKPRHVPSWLLLSAAAGFVNGFAFLTCQQFVTHVTGTVTRMGLEWPQIGIAAEYLTVFLSFIVGAAVAVIMVQIRARAGGRDHWAIPLLAVALILGGVAMAGHFGAFGPFGGIVTTDPPPVLLLSLLAFASGLQNASVTAITGMSVRTTHLTGPTTDMGMLLGAAYLSSGEVRRSALSGAVLRAGMAFTFMIGAGLSLMAGWWGFLALLVPTGFVLIAGGMSFIPDWSPGDYPLEQESEQKPPSGPLAGLPADARPQKETSEATEPSSLSRNEGGL